MIRHGMTLRPLRARIGPRARATGRRLLRWLRDLGLILGGVTMITLALNVFMEPNDVVPGGYTALSIFANRLWGWPVGITLLALNIPSLLIGMRWLGAELGPKTLLTTTAISLGIDLSRPYLPTVQGEPLLYVAYGGLLYGLGMALIFRAGASSGGTDIPARLLKHFWGFRVSRSLLVMDVAVLALAAAFFGLGPALYALITAWVMTRVLDAVELGLDGSFTTFIVSAEPERIRATILAELDRGVTVLQGEGGFTGAPRPVLMTVVNRRQLRRLRRLLAETDPSAFMVVNPSKEVLGEGFAPLPSVGGR